MDIAVGSAMEARYLLHLAVDLGLLAADDAQVGRECSDHVVRALQKLQQAVGRFEG